MTVQVQPIFFARDINDNWIQQARLTASDGAYLASFGSSVAISGTTVIVGARSATEKPVYNRSCLRICL